MARWDELCLNRSCDGIVHPLVYRRSDPAVVLAMHHHLRDLKSCKVAQPEPHEFALLVKLIQLFQRLCERQTAIRSVQVEDVYAICPQLFQALVETGFEVLWFVNARLVGVALRC